MTQIADLVAPLVALAEAGIPPDVQEMLVRGDPMRGIAPGALSKALTATISDLRAENARLEAELEEAEARAARIEAETIERCAQLIEEGYERPIGWHYRQDHKPSKHDRCPHDLDMRDPCDECAAAAIRAMKKEG